MRAKGKSERGGLAFFFLAGRRLPYLLLEFFRTLLGPMARICDWQKAVKREGTETTEKMPEKSLSPP